MSPTQRAAAVLALAVLGCGLSGCKYTASLDKQEVVVYFQADASQAQHQQVLTACGNIPNVLPETAATAGNAAALAYNVRFLVTGATVAQEAQLYDCLAPFYPKIVKGYDKPDYTQ